MSIILTINCPFCHLTLPLRAPSPIRLLGIVSSSFCLYLPIWHHHTVSISVVLFLFPWLFARLSWSNPLSSFILASMLALSGTGCLHFFLSAQFSPSSFLVFQTDLLFSCFSLCLIPIWPSHFDDPRLTLEVECVQSSGVTFIYFYCFISVFCM